MILFHETLIFPKGGTQMYLYHLVPPNMDGTILYPLNELKFINPALYQTHAHKYWNRKAVMEKWIPTLNCKWNDVLFFTAVHPVVFRQAFERFCRPPRPFQCFKFDPIHLNPTRMTVVTKMSGPGKERENSYESFDPHNFSKHAVIPQDTLDYWRDQMAEGNKSIFWWLHIPHILHRGPLDTRFATVEESTA